MSQMTQNKKKTSNKSNDDIDFGPKDAWWDDENDDIDSVKVNKNQSLVDQQKLDRRPRFEIRSALVLKKNLKPIFTGKL